MAQQAILVNNFEVDGPVQYGSDTIESEYEYRFAVPNVKPDGSVTVSSKSSKYNFRTERKVPKLGVMLVGLGGNNGSTVVAGALANQRKMEWHTKDGKCTSNYFGSVTQASTVNLGTDPNTGREIVCALKDMVPMVSPSDMVWGGWDISNMNLADAMERAKVLDWDLQQQLRPLMKDIVPLPSIYDPDFIAANQSERANNCIPGTKAEKMEQIRKDLREFKEKNRVDKVVVLWTANTERFALVNESNDTAEHLLNSINSGNDSEISPSTLFAVACILEKVTFINGSPQNAFVPGAIELAYQHGVNIAGDDFKSGQTKFKSVLVDFLIGAGIKPRSIVSYNHLGNNDGKNLSVQKTFRSKEVSKSGVVEDMVASNPILYKEGESPDHTIVIKYIPFVQDSKRAMDEYISEIFMGGHNTIVCHNTCEDSLLATPIIYDLIILAELCDRITIKKAGTEAWCPLHPILNLLSYLCKAPLVPEGAKVVNALFRQRACLENFLRACVGLPPDDNMRLPELIWEKTPAPNTEAQKAAEKITQQKLAGPAVAQVQPVAVTNV